MRLVLSDTSFIANLHKAALLEPFIRLPYVIVVPLPIFDDTTKVLDEGRRRRLIRLGLGVVNSTDAGVLKVMRYANKYRALRAYDCFALAVAEDPGPSVLLTDDKPLGRVARDHGHGVRGLRWATAQVLEHRRRQAGQLDDTLNALRNTPLRPCPPHPREPETGDTDHSRPRPAGR